MDRNIIQEQAKTSFLSASDKKGILLIGTGVGKSKIAIDIALDINPSKILILTSSIKGRDSIWKKEFEEWGKSTKLWEKVTCMCYQSANKMRFRSFDLLIADELDFGLTDEYSKVFEYNKFKYMLGLTATLTPDKEVIGIRYFNEILFKYSTQDAQRNKILNSTKVNIIKYPLSLQETAKYISLNTKLEQAKFIASNSGKGEGFVRKCAGAIKIFLHSLNSSISTTKGLIGYLTKNSENKVLIFSAMTSQCDSIAKHTYHSKNKKGNDNIAKLSTGEIQSLGVCQAVNRGINLEKVNHLIFEGFTGSITEFQQRHGRGTRLEVTEELNIWIMIPYYKDKGELNWTLSYNWAKKMMDGFNYTENLNQIIIT